jgi:enoyl-CoA hydratase/carnithine racemase
MSERILSRIDDGIAHVSLNRPEKLNSLDLEMFRALVAAQKELAGRRGLRAVVLDGSGRDFCSGLDVKSVMKNRGHMLALLRKWHPWKANLAQRVSTGWRDLPVPVIAAIHGRCWGGGMQIALGADFRIAAPDASLSIMEGRWGLIPDMGGLLGLRGLMHFDQALRLTLTAEEISGIRALELGLVTAISENPRESALELARQIRDRSPDAVREARALYRRKWRSGEGSVLAAETWRQIRVLRGGNQRIAVRRQLGEDVDWID